MHIKLNCPCLCYRKKLATKDNDCAITKLDPSGDMFFLEMFETSFENVSEKLVLFIVCSSSTTCICAHPSWSQIFKSITTSVRYNRHFQSRVMKSKQPNARKMILRASSSPSNAEESQATPGHDKLNWLNGSSFRSGSGLNGCSGVVNRHAPWT